MIEKISYYSDEVAVGKYTVSAINPVYDADGNLADGSVTLLQDGSDQAFPADCKVRYEGNKAIIEGSNSFQVNLILDANMTNTTDITLDLMVYISEIFFLVSIWIFNPTVLPYRNFLTAPLF